MPAKKVNCQRRRLPSDLASELASTIKERSTEHIPKPRYGQLPLVGIRVGQLQLRKPRAASPKGILAGRAAFGEGTTTVQPIFRFYNMSRIGFPYCVKPLDGRQTSCYSGFRDDLSHKGSGRSQVEAAGAPLRTPFHPPASLPLVCGGLGGKGGGRSRVVYSRSREFWA